VAILGRKYRYNKKDTEAAPAKLVDSLGLFKTQLENQRASGSSFLVGDRLSAVDIYFVAVMNLVAPLPKEKCPLPDGLRPFYVAADPDIVTLLSPILLDHRDRIFEAYFRAPMEF
jgi:glutathione S-transferase